MPLGDPRSTALASSAPSAPAAPEVRGNPRKVRDRIGVITDLLLGAAHADREFAQTEHRAVRRLLCELLLTEELPPEVDRRIDEFRPESFDLKESAADFLSDPPMNKRRLLELVGQMCYADGVYHLDEDTYIRELAEALGLAPEQYADLVLDYEIEELRESLDEIRMTPATGLTRPVLPPR